MKIAVLGWGSLCWDPNGLKFKGSWNTDGPKLPVEFSRISMDGRLTLVLTEDVRKVNVLWVESYFTKLKDAIENRELERA